MTAQPPTGPASGFSYVEVLIATALVAISLVPAIDALHSGIMAGSVHGDSVRRHAAVQSRMEELLAMPFDTLDAAALTAGSYLTPTSLSDPGGTSDRRLVYLARFDTDNADADNNTRTGGEAGLLWLRVEVEGALDALETLVAQP